MNKFKQTLAAQQARAQQWWQARSEQERRLLAVGGIFLALVLFYLVLLDPALSGRERLRKELPQLRQDAAEMQALAMQASSLNSQPAIAPPPMSKDSLTASLAARSLAAQSIALTGEYAKLQLKGVSFAGLVDWLDVQRRDYRIAVQEASFTAQSPEGQVDAILTLHQGQGRP